MKKKELFFIVIISTALMALALGCGGGGGGGSDAVFRGVVLDVGNGDNGTPAPGATVELWSLGSVVLEDGTTTDADGMFELDASGVEGKSIFFKTSKAGYVPLNTQVHFVDDLSAIPSSLELPLVSEDVALQLGSNIWGYSESSWNSTLQANAYLVMDVYETATDYTPAGVTILDVSSGGAVLNSTNIYYNDGSDVFATSNQTSVSDSSTDMPAVAAQVVGASADTLFSFQTSGHPDGIFTEDAYLIPGQITYVEIEP